jgi:hypothetical protein
MGAARDPWGCRFQQDHDRTDVQGTPPAPAIALVVLRAAPPTQAAPILGLAQGPDRGDEEPRFLVKIDALDHRFLDTKQSDP